MIKIFLACLLLFGQPTIYNFKVRGITGTEINFNDFRGKKILVVNIATGSRYAGQLSELQQLYQRCGDSLVIVCFPTNSFGNENRTNAAIKEYCQSRYATGLLLATRGSVKGSDKQPLYHWLSHKDENGAFNYEVAGDFQKYLFDRDGNPLGVFAGSVSPLDHLLTDVITGAQK